MPTPALDVRHVRKTYVESGESHSVLDDVSLALDPGAFAALLGRSGAGKSTFLNVVAGIDLPDSGSVRIDGVDVAAQGEDARTDFRRRHLGFVFQAFNLVPTLTAVENVALPLTLNGVSRREALERARSFLDRVGLERRADAFPDRMSGGEQQRVAIVRALIHGPRLLLADEPTGNLDYETGRQVMDLLHGLVRDMGITMLVVTHDRDFLRASDRILQLKGGRLADVAAPDLGHS